MTKANIVLGAKLGKHGENSLAKSASSDQNTSMKCESVKDMNARRTLSQGKVTKINLQHRRRQQEVLTVRNWSQGQADEHDSYHNINEIS
jgi:hypothetical protein